MPVSASPARSSPPCAKTTLATISHSSLTPQSMPRILSSRPRCSPSRPSCNPRSRKLAKRKEAQGQRLKLTRRTWRLYAKNGGRQAGYLRRSLEATNARLTTEPHWLEGRKEGFGILGEEERGLDVKVAVRECAMCGHPHLNPAQPEIIPIGYACTSQPQTRQRPPPLGLRHPARIRTSFALRITDLEAELEESRHAIEGMKEDVRSLERDVRGSAGGGGWSRGRGCFGVLNLPSSRSV